MVATGNFDRFSNEQFQFMERHEQVLLKNKIFFFFLKKEKKFRVLSVPRKNMYHSLSVREQAFGCEALMTVRELATEFTVRCTSVNFIRKRFRACTNILNNKRF